MEGNARADSAELGAYSFGPSQPPAIIAAAHELKSPLALMRQLALAIETGEGDVETLARRITLTSERALRLTSDLTRASRLEDSLFTLEPLNPMSVLDDVAYELSPLFAARGRALTVRNRRRSLLAVANRDLLRRIVTNFVDNALHYCNGSQPVELWARADIAGIVRVGVRDYGPAVPADIWKTIEDGLGSRAQTLQARPESSGLGMYVAGQFASAMGATVGATRHKDGATFYIDLNASTQMRLL